MGKVRKKNKAKAQKTAAILSGLILVGCVKTVYLPEDAHHYKQLLDSCRHRKLELQSDLDECIEVGTELHDASISN